MKKILILGSNGSLGTALTRRLSSQDFIVYQFKRTECQNSKVLNLEQIKSNPPNIDIVINCLAKYSRTSKSEKEIRFSNYELPLIIFKKLITANSNIWIYNLHTEIANNSNLYAKYKHMLHEILQKSFNNTITFTLPIIVGDSAPKSGLFFDLYSSTKNKFSSKTPYDTRKFLCLNDFLNKIETCLRVKTQKKIEVKFEDVLFSFTIKQLTEWWYEEQYKENDKFIKEIFRIKNLFTQEAGSLT